MQIEPNFILALNNLAGLLNQQGDFYGAADLYHQAISFDPDFAKAHNNLGSALAGQGRFEEAIPHFERAINIDPDYTDARKNLELARSLAAGPRPGEKAISH